MAAGGLLEILEPEERPGETLVDAEPDQQQRQDHEMPAAHHEPLELKSLAVRDEQAGGEVKGDKPGRGQRGLPPAPADRGRQQRQDKEQEKGAGRTVGREDDRGEHRHVQGMGGNREPRIEPPVAPGRDHDQDR